MANIDLSKVIGLAENHEFWAVRGKAIQSYANLEQGLAGLLSHLAGASREAAATILFRISSSDSRGKILEKLFRQKYSTEFNLFRNSFFDQLRPLDIARNEIVHWNAACEAGCDEHGNETAVVLLIPPAATAGTFAKNTPKKYVSDIRLFSDKCSFYTGLIGMFPLMMEPNPHIPEDVRRTWLEVFELPVAYPPPTGHPLFRTEPVPENHIVTFLV
ncbi:hypothetical protein [Bradyrhizobium sp. JYMT SZCCT0428]|uniref:hypothetical protein n=1 Tax=Bradyrhizobium sp. JYMT SZCCT0428 TaxID=2807673 RepID=UPI001BAC7650|nr:hypothetical protein [Bradyrhizobium sp. JYMT SZCCT0428]MBR1151879.1 hypothetical protein [Bradyrhizobium sp. JYMT SZCCT0428]